MDKSLLILHGQEVGGSSGGGGLTQEEHDALMSLAAYEPNMYDINPNKEAGSSVAAGCIKLGVGSSNPKCYMPVCGYDKLALYKYSSSGTSSFKWAYSDGSESETVSSLSSNTWSEYYTIPSNAICAIITGTYTADSWITVNYSLLTKDSPYNPDNQ